MNTETEIHSPVISAATWPHNDHTRGVCTAVVFAQNADAFNLVCWALGQTQVALDVLRLVLDRDKERDELAHAVFGILGSAKPALELALAQLREHRAPKVAA